MVLYKIGFIRVKINGQFVHSIEKPNIKSPIEVKAILSSGIKVKKRMLKIMLVATANVTNLAMIYSVK